MANEITVGSLVQLANDSGLTPEIFIVSYVGDNYCTLYYKNSITGTYQTFPCDIPKEQLTKL